MLLFSFAFLILFMLGHARDVPESNGSSTDVLTCCGDHTAGKAVGRRVVSVSDWHGDAVHSLDALDRLGICRQGRWVGGEAILVHTGDIFDRGDAGKELIELLFRLQDEAPASGGKVVFLLGNHEEMNMQEDVRYVTAGDFLAYGGPTARAKAWDIDGATGSEIRKRSQALFLVGDVVFVHAGLLPDILEAMAPGLRGSAAVDAVNEYHKSVISRSSRELAASTDPILLDDGPFWTRALSLGSEAASCSQLQRTLAVLGAKRMVVGHTPQESGNIGRRCDGQLVLADTLLSQAYTQNAEQSRFNEAAVEFYGSGGERICAVYPARSQNARCVVLTTSGGLRQSGTTLVNSAEFPFAAAIIPTAFVFVMVAAYVARKSAVNLRRVKAKPSD